MELVQFRLKNKIFFIRMKGRLEFRASAALDTAIGWIKNDKSIQRVIVDLSVATSIDSTHLGLLADLGLFSNQKHSLVPVLAAGATPRVKQTLSKLQLHTLYRWKTDEENFGIHGAEYATVLGPTEEPESIVCERAIRAHQVLMSLGECNRTEFTSVVAGLQIEKAMLCHHDGSHERSTSLNNLKNKPTVQQKYQRQYPVH